jgi:putative transposase
VIRFVDENRSRFGVEPVCRVLKGHGVKIAPRTYWAAKRRPPSARSRRDEALKPLVEDVFHDRLKGRGLAGARKVYHLLRRDAHQVARCTVERLMRELGLKGATRGDGKVRTTRRDESAPRPPDLVNRQFKSEAPNRLWVVDFTYVPTWSGTGFTAFVTDVFSRRVVGWRTAARMPVELPLDALEMALWVRGKAGQSLDGLVHHSDAGSQYTAIKYAERLADAGALASIGTVGDSYDNALAESEIGLYKRECVRHDGPFKTVDELELATLSWVHWFNEHRLHSKIGNIPPVEFEAKYYAQQQPLTATAAKQTALH